MKSSQVLLAFLDGKSLHTKKSLSHGVDDL